MLLKIRHVEISTVLTVNHGRYGLVSGMQRHRHLVQRALSAAIREIVCAGVHIR